MPSQPHRQQVHDPAQGEPRRRSLRLRDQRIGVKVGLVVMVCLGFMALQAASDVVRMRALAAESRDLYVHDASSIADLGTARDAVALMRQRVLLHVLAVPADKPRRLGQIKELDARFDAAIARLRPKHAVPEAEMTRWLALVQEYRTFRDDVLLPASTRQVTGTELADLLARCDRTFGPVEEESEHINGILVDQARRQSDNAEVQAADAQRTTWGLLAIGLLLGGGLALVVTRLVTRPLARVSDVLAAVAGGDLTVRATVTGRDEAGRMAASLDVAVAMVRDAVAAMTSASGTLATASDALSGASRDIAVAADRTESEAGVASDAVSEIASGTRSVAAGAEEMSASIQEIAQSAGEAARVAGQAVTEAGRTTEVIGRLGVSSREIEDVIKIITSLAEQTNLLALNATIEAARAGEAGKGFAVVADEVKQLAQGTAAATGQIVDRVQAIQGDVSTAVVAIEGISAVVADISAFQTTIAGAVEEQTATTRTMTEQVALTASRAEAVRGNIDEVSRAAALTTSGVHQAGTLAAELADVSTELKHLVGRFTT